MKRIYLSLITVFVIISTSLISTAQPLNGAYTIDAGQPTGGTNFQSFTDFSTALTTNGVNGNVVATVAPGSGPYVEQVTFALINGLSASSTVTLDGSGELITALTDSANRHVVRLRELQYFTITNLKVRRDTTAASGFYGIHIFGSGDNITISDCEIEIPGTTSTLTGGIIASGSETSILAAGDFHNITYTGNTCTGGGYGASLYGEAANLSTNVVISDNTFYDFHSNGIYLRETDGVIVSGNFFDKRTPNVTSANCIQLAQAANINGNIYNNTIQISQTSNGTMTLRGIYLFNGTGHKVYNNVIHNIMLTSGNFTAIAVRTGGTAPEISFNTINFDNPISTSGELIGIEEELSNTNSVLRNNLISITQPSTAMSTALALGATSTVTTALNSEYNLFYVPLSNVAIKNGTSPTAYATLTAWRAASGQDQFSLDVDPMFTAGTPVPTNPAANDAGTPVNGITTDILGVTRSATPDIGAYEWMPVGIGNITSVKDFAVYPNPVNDRFTFELSSATNANVRMQVYDVNGRLADEQVIAVIAGKGNASVSHLASGRYVVTLLSDQGQWKSTLFKN